MTNIVVGKDIKNNIDIYLPIEQVFPMKILGATGQGKTFYIKKFLNNIIGKFDFRLVLIAPKWSFEYADMSLSNYLITPINDGKNVLEILNDLLIEKNERLIEKRSAIPIIVIIDECIDIIEKYPNVKEKIEQLAVECNKSKIYLIVSSQRKVPVCDYSLDISPGTEIHSYNLFSNYLGNRKIKI